MKNSPPISYPSKSSLESAPIPEAVPECLLSNPDLDIIPETHHLTGQCLCHLCTCGKHICKYPRHQTVKGSFKSHYQRNYKIKPLEPQTQKKISYVYHPRNLCFYGETTNQKEYRAHSVTPTPKIEKRRSMTPNYKFIGNTHYQSQYPDWGPVAHDIYEKPQPSHCTNLKFNSRSSYSDSYQPVSQSVNLNLERNDTSRESNGRFTELSKSVYDIPETTNNKYFKSHQATDYNTLVQRRAFIYTPTCFSPCQYKSSNQRTYTHQGTTLIDPRKYKLFKK